MTCESAKPFVLFAYGVLVTAASATAVINPVGACYYLGLLGLILGPVLIARAVPSRLFLGEPTLVPVRVAVPVTPKGPVRR